MAHDTFDYPRMIAHALRGVAREALTQTAEHGLPGEHHFYLSFETSAEGVRVPGFLRDQYPEEMTVVLQNQFWDLVVDDEAFSVSLTFNGSRHRVVVPWRALTAFADPSAQVGLHFEPPDVLPEAVEGAGDDGAAAAPESRFAAAAAAAASLRQQGAGEDVGDGEATEAADGGPAGESEGGKVVRLDRFRQRSQGEAASESEATSDSTAEPASGSDSDADPDPDPDPDPTPDPPPGRVV